MNQDLVCLDQFDWTNFIRWQDKFQFLLTTLNISYILDSELAPLSKSTHGDTDAIRVKRQKCQENELICCSHILNALSNRLYSLYRNTSPVKEIQDALENKYNVEEEVIKNLLISTYFDFKFLDNIPFFLKYMNYKLLSTSRRWPKLRSRNLFKQK